MFTKNEKWLIVQIEVNLKIDLFCHFNDCVIIIVIIIIIILVITFMQGIYNYIPETNHVSKVNSVAALQHYLLLQFVLHVMLFFP